ncbi:MAG: DNA-3-methyladenine glycosylase [Acidobacteria bacterium RIFCSPLOWO2_12_FULL_54_10]|nr:MAG: DNA-3-methyladenine glycosylase [Acidobacteria bacterium RIFCSPLOWO2_12_FULL_54_10]
MSAQNSPRCHWAASGNNPLMIAYHDHEWGVPVHDDRRLFEFLILEGAQAGLSWQTILNKRENYRHALRKFDPAKIVRFTEKDKARLLANAGIIRNRLKIDATITNAKSFLAVQSEFSSFDRYIWRFVGGQPIQNSFRSFGEIPAKTREAESMSKDLLRRGFKFVGPTICYAFMQATGLSKDHTMDCFRYQAVRKSA